MHGKILAAFPLPTAQQVRSYGESEAEANDALQEERLAVSIQEGADLPLDHLRLDAPKHPSLWKEQYQVNSFCKCTCFS